RERAGGSSAVALQSPQDVVDADFDVAVATLREPRGDRDRPGVRVLEREVELERSVALRYRVLDIGQPRTSSLVLEDPWVLGFRAPRRRLLELIRVLDAGEFEEIVGDPLRVEIVAVTGGHEDRRSIVLPGAELARAVSR